MSDRELYKDSNPFEAVTSAAYLSNNFFNTAESLRLMAWESATDNDFKFSGYTYSAVIMYATSLETFINEIGCNEIQNFTLNKQKVGLFLAQVRADVKLDKCFWYDDILCLIKIRNELIHYTPKMRKVNTCPSDIYKAIKRSKIVLNKRIGYIMNLGNPEFADWSNKVVMKFAKEACKNLWPGFNTLMPLKDYGAVMQSISSSEIETAN